MRVFTVYRDHPRFTDKYIVVPAEVAPLIGYKPDAQPMASGATLEQVRSALPDGLVQFPREPLDDPTVVETWL